MEGFDQALLDRLRDALGDETFEELARDFVTDLPRLSSVIGGAEDRGDVAAVKEAAHELKGMAVLFGAVELAAACTELMTLDETPWKVVRQKVDAAVALCETARGLVTRTSLRTAS